MIEIKKDNKFKVLKPELFKAGEKLLGKYKLWENEAMIPTHICFTRFFGSKEDFEFYTFNILWFGYAVGTKEMYLNCSSHGGTARFVFTEESLKNKDLNIRDKQCIGYTLNLLRELEQEGVIEI